MAYISNSHTPFQEIHISFPTGCQVGFFSHRYKRFSVAVHLAGQEEWCHSNNTGSMLGLLRPHSPILLSPAQNPKRKLAWTQEAVWLGRGAANSHDGFWVGVNTNTPNAMLAVAFDAGALPFATGYTKFVREAKRGESRLDACLTGDGRPPLWVECKNVTMVEDDVACFPDAITVRGQKHMRELMDIVRGGERAVMFYLVQRPDARCFAPADFIDSEYADLFWEAQGVGVEIYAYTAHVNMAGIYLGAPLDVLQSSRREG